MLYLEIDTLLEMESFLTGYNYDKEEEKDCKLKGIKISRLIEVLWSNADMKIIKENLDEIVNLRGE